jgi:hypothetical protein
MLGPAIPWVRTSASAITWIGWLRPAIPRAGRSRLCVPAARTRPAGTAGAVTSHILTAGTADAVTSHILTAGTAAGVTSHVGAAGAVTSNVLAAGSAGPATGLVLAIGLLLRLTALCSAGPVSLGRLRGTGPAQVPDPLVVGVITEAAGASVPLFLKLTGTSSRGLLRCGLTSVILSRAGPRLSDGLSRSRSPRPARSLGGLPLPGIALAIKVMPSGVLPRLNAVVPWRPGFVIRGMRRPLVLPLLRPSAAHEVSYP